MANVIKDITVNWSWSGDTYAIDGFNVAVTPSTDNPKTSVTVMAFAQGNVTTYKLRDITLDSTLTYTAWVQAVYDGGDSDWISAGNLAVTDDGTSTIATKTQVDTAQADATSALNKLTDIASDNKLTSNEKSDTLKEWNIITGEKANIDAQADVYSITSEKTIYDNAYTALATYLNGGTAWSAGVPLWLGTDVTNGLSATTTIDGPTFRTTFKTYYDARTSLLKKVQDSAKGYVDNISVGGTNILTGTNSISTIGTSGSWSAMTWRQASSGTGTRTILSVTDAPNPSITTGVEIVQTATGANNTDIAQDAVPVTNGQTYTLSCYARSSTAGGVTLRFQYGKSPYPSKTYIVSTSSWSKYYFTFTIGSVSDGSTSGNTNIYLGLANTSVGTLDICGMKLETGNKATDWNPSPTDIDANITKAQTAIDNMLADNIIDYSERKSIKDSLTDIIGYVIGDTQSMPTISMLDTLGNGNFSSVRTAALAAGILSNTTAYQAVETAYSELAAYMNGLNGTPPAADTTPPGNVSSLTETHSYDTVSLNWANPSNSDFGYVKIYQGATLIKDSFVGSSYIVTGLTKLTQYTFKVTSVDKSGNESSGTSITVTTIDNTDSFDGGGFTDPSGGALDGGGF